MPTMLQLRTRNRQAAPKRAKTTSPQLLAPSSSQHAPPSPGTSSEAPKPLAVTPVRVRFQVYEPHARHVTLAGEFNQWNPDAAPMQPHDDGHWSITLELPPGRHHYKFVIDEQRLPDLTAPENVPNEHGTLNSLIDVRYQTDNTRTKRQASNY